MLETDGTLCLELSARMKLKERLDPFKNIASQHDYFEPDSIARWYISTGTETDQALKDLPYRIVILHPLIRLSHFLSIRAKAQVS